MTTIDQAMNAEIQQETPEEICYLAQTLLLNVKKDFQNTFINPELAIFFKLNRSDDIGQILNFTNSTQNRDYLFMGEYADISKKLGLRELDLSFDGRVKAESLPFPQEVGKFIRINCNVNEECTCIFNGLEPVVIQPPQPPPMRAANKTG